MKEGDEDEVEEEKKVRKIRGVYSGPSTLAHGWDHTYGPVNTALMRTLASMHLFDAGFTGDAVPEQAFRDAHSFAAYLNDNGFLASSLGSGSLDTLFRKLSILSKAKSTRNEYVTNREVQAGMRALIGQELFSTVIQDDGKTGYNLRYLAQAVNLAGKFSKSADTRLTAD